MGEAFDYKLKESLKEKAKIAFVEAVKRLIKAAFKVRRAAQHYDDEELSEMNDEMCDCCQVLNTNLTLYVNTNRELIDYSNNSDVYTYFCDDDNYVLEDWYENRISLYDAGFCLCRWRDELREEEQDEMVEAQLVVIETLIRTLSKALSIFQNNGFGDLPSIEKAYQMMVVNINNNYEFHAGSMYVDFRTNY